jgi:hypothetical protein
MTTAASALVQGALAALTADGKAILQTSINKSNKL